MKKFLALLICLTPFFAAANPLTGYSAAVEKARFIEASLTLKALADSQRRHIQIHGYAAQSFAALDIEIGGAKTLAPNKIQTAAYFYELKDYGKQTKNFQITLRPLSQKGASNYYAVRTNSLFYCEAGEKAKGVCQAKAYHLEKYHPEAKTWVYFYEGAPDSEKKTRSASASSAPAAKAAKPKKAPEPVVMEIEFH